MGEGPALPLFLRPSGIPRAFRGALRNGTFRYETSFPNEALSKDSLARKALEREGLRTGRSGEGGKEGPTFFRKVFPPFPNLPSHFPNNLRHADETADAARPPASAAPVLGNRRLAVRRGNRHGTFSGSGFNGLRPVCMGGQPDAPPSLLPAGGCVRHRRLVDRRKVRSPRPPRVPGMAGKEPVLTAGRHRSSVPAACRISVCKSFWTMWAPPKRNRSPAGWP